MVCMYFSKVNQITMNPKPNGNVENDADKLPQWLETVTFENAARTFIGENFNKIVNVRPESYPSSNGNYSSLLLRLHLDVELTGYYANTYLYTYNACSCANFSYPCFILTHRNFAYRWQLENCYLRP